MLKTYLYIPDDLEKQINQVVQAQKKSKAEILRQALEKGIKAIQLRGDASVQVLFKIAELGKKNKVKGPKDAVEHFDEYLYGKDWGVNE